MPIVLPTAHSLDVDYYTTRRRAWCRLVDASLTRHRHQPSFAISLAALGVTPLTVRRRVHYALAQLAVDCIHPRGYAVTLDWKHRQLYFSAVPSDNSPHDSIEDDD